MKKLLDHRSFAALLALAWIVSCQNPELEVQLPENSEASFAVSQKQARELAQHFVTDLKEGNDKSSARVSSVTDFTDEKPVVDNATKEPLLYIINRRKGFIVVSADFRTMPVLAYSDESRFEIESMPEGVKTWLETAKQKIKDVKKPSMIADSIVIKEWQKYLTGNLNLPTPKGARTASNSCYEYYQWGQYTCQAPPSHSWGPYLTTTWGQDRIASSSLTWAPSSCGDCNRFLAGCGPVAMAQVWEFYRPNPSLPRTSNFSCTATTAGDVGLGMLMQACGTASNADYNYLGTCNTFTWPNNVRSGLSLMGFANGGSQTVGYNYSVIRSELSTGHPIIFWGSSCLTCFNNYHIWVADGLQESSYAEFSCETLGCTTWTYSYIHMNWGWEGRSNGWYGFGTYNPGGNNFNTNLHIISGIRS